MRRSGWGLAVCAALLLGPSGGSAPAQEGPPSNLPSPVDGALRAALDEQVEALNAEDPDAVVALFHSEAPNFREVRRSLVELFRARDLRYKLDAYRFVAEDRPYAYARCTQTTEPLDGKGDARRVEQLFVFRRSGDEWRFWTSALLRELDPPARPGSR